ncbi:hypothetical protein GUJ93_ZPchr2171g28976 [Zizania palustris]|uniref:Uncharacterized protein n=1 Tax=Zizania palustris TaxID=103762 RepID=A0A8J5QUI0_ZIZPA|nr:hypothetical protein GUJ93_ZPchr2171g28976 [Zizania palustris]
METTTLDVRSWLMRVAGRAKVAGGARWEESGTRWRHLSAMVLVPGGCGWCWFLAVLRDWGGGRAKIGDYDDEASEDRRGRQRSIGGVWGGEGGGTGVGRR